MSGEMTHTWEDRGRRITLDPIMDREPLLVQPVRVESNIAAGFRVQFLSGENDKIDIDLCAGAGMGSPWLTLTVKDKVSGETYEEVVDMRPFLNDWVDAALAAGPSPKWNWEKGAFE